MFRLLKRLKKSHENATATDSSATATASGGVHVQAPLPPPPSSSSPGNRKQQQDQNDDESSGEYSNYDNLGERSQLNNKSDVTTATSSSNHSGRRHRRRRRRSLQHNNSSSSGNGSHNPRSRKRDHNGNPSSGEEQDDNNKNTEDHLHHHDGDDADINVDEDGGDVGDDDGSVSSYSSGSSSTSSSEWSDYDNNEFSRLLSLTVQHQSRQQQKQQQVAQDQDAADEQQQQQQNDDHMMTTEHPSTAISSSSSTDEQQTSTDAAGAATTTTTSTTTATKVKGKVKKSDLLEDLARTHFPDFFMESEQGVPGAIKVGEDSSSESSDDEAAVERKAVRYRTKEDQDVAVFLSLAQRMSLESLLHLLQGHVQSQKEELARAYMQQYRSILNRQDTNGSSSSLASGAGDYSNDAECVSCSSSHVRTDSVASSLCSITELDEVVERSTTPKVKSILKSSHTQGDSTDTDVAMNKEETPHVADDESKKPKPLPEHTEDDDHYQQQHAHRHRKHKHKAASQEKQPPRLVKGKQFRFALVMNDQVRAVVHDIDSYKEYADDMWWSREEMNAIRGHLIETVKFFRKHRPLYLQSVEIVARNANMLLEKPALLDESSSLNNGATIPPELLKLHNENVRQQTAIVEEHMKSLMNADHAYARGLETHICKFLSDHRRSTVHAVIEEQDDCRNCHDDDDTTVHCLREQSVAYSHTSAKFAAALGRCDHIDALKASMSSWEAEV